MEIVQELLDRGCNVNSESNTRLSPLLAASARGHVSTAKLLLYHQANASATDANGLNAAHYACIRSSIDILKLLENSSVDWDAFASIAIRGTQQVFSAPLLYLDVFYRGTCLEYLLQKGLVYQATWNTSGGWLPLHAACGNGSLHQVKLLLEFKADIHATMPGSVTPLHLAPSSGHTKVVQLLLDNGARASAQDTSGMMPLHLAQRNGHQSIVELLQTSLKAEGKFIIAFSYLFLTRL